MKSKQTMNIVSGAAKPPNIQMKCPSARGSVILRAQDSFA